MSRAHITDTEDNRKAVNGSEKFAQDAVRESYQNTAKMSKKAIATVAALAALLSKLAMEGIKGIFNRFNNRDRQQDSSLGDVTDLLKNKRGQKQSGKLMQRLGNKTRGLVRGRQARKLSKVANSAKNANRFAKTANAAKNMRNAGGLVKTANSMAKVNRLAKTAKVASTAVKGAKLAKTANTAYKVAKVAKLANVARIGLQGGVALAGGPVGIALFAGSVLAPYAIEAVWKNKEKIYEGGKKLVTKSKMSVQEVAGMLDGKKAQVGEVVPRARDLKVVGDNQQVLLETDSKGKVLTNNFDPNHKLAFYQQQPGENTMLLDEADLGQSVSATLEQGSEALKAPMQKGTSVIQNSLTQLQQNNPDNPQIQQQTQMLSGAVSTAKTQPQITGVKDAIGLNEAGSSIINLFESQIMPEQTGQKLETAEFDISRRGNDYFLKNKEGDLLLQTTNTAFGSKILSANLTPDLMQDLAYLKQDLRLGKGITGGFAPMSELQSSQAPVEAAQTKSQPESTGKDSSVLMSRRSPLEDARPEPSQPQAKETVALPTSAFSQYLPQEDKVPAMAGNSKEKSNDLER